MMIKSEAKPIAPSVTAVAECVSERSLIPDMEYVCRGDNNHGGEQATILRALANKDYATIRATFHARQSHDVELQNRLACYSDPQLRTLIEGHCPAPKPPPPKNRTDH